MNDHTDGGVGDRTLSSIGRAEPSGDCQLTDSIETSTDNLTLDRGHRDDQCGSCYCPESDRTEPTGLSCSPGSGQGRPGSRGSGQGRPGSPGSVQDCPRPRGSLQGCPGSSGGSLCSVEGCPGSSGGGSLCSVEGCPGSLCSVEGCPGSLCSVEGCPGSSGGGSLCSVEGCPGSLCSVEGCPGSSGGGSLCSVEGCPGSSGGGSLCSVEGCPGSSGGGSLCSVEGCPGSPGISCGSSQGCSGPPGGRSLRSGEGRTPGLSIPFSMTRAWPSALPSRDQARIVSITTLQAIRLKSGRVAFLIWFGCHRCVLPPVILSRSQGPRPEEFAPPTDRQRVLHVDGRSRNVPLPWRAPPETRHQVHFLPGCQKARSTAPHHFISRLALKARHRAGGTSGRIRSVVAPRISQPRRRAGSDRGSEPTTGS